MYARKSIEIWYLKSPVHSWMRYIEEVNSVDEAKEAITELKKVSPWGDYAYRVITVTRTYVIDHSE